MVAVRKIQHRSNHLYDVPSAVERGMWGVEIDVRRAPSGALVCAHDHTDTSCAVLLCKQLEYCQENNLFALLDIKEAGLVSDLADLLANQADLQYATFSAPLAETPFYAKLNGLQHESPFYTTTMPSKIGIIHDPYGLWSESALRKLPLSLDGYTFLLDSSLHRFPSSEHLIAQVLRDWGDHLVLVTK